MKNRIITIISLLAIYFSSTSCYVIVREKKPHHPHASSLPAQDDIQRFSIRNNYDKTSALLNERATSNSAISDAVYSQNEQ